MREVAITLTRYNESNEVAKSCLSAISLQNGVLAEAYFLDQKDDEEMKEFCRRISTENVKVIYERIPANSHSYARNAGMKLAKTDIVLFVDCDAIPDTHWAEELAAVFELSEKIAIVGGKSEPLWLKRPPWYAKSNIVWETYSLIDLGGVVMPATKIVGVNFALNRKRLGSEAYFSEDLGRRPGSLLSGDETDLCKRALAKGLQVYYTPKAAVKHQIQEERMSVLWLVRRFYFGGLGRAISGGPPKTHTRRNVYDFLVMPIILPPYFLGYLFGVLKRK